MAEYLRCVSLVSLSFAWFNLFANKHFSKYFGSFLYLLRFQIADRNFCRLYFSGSALILANSALVVWLTHEVEKRRRYAHGWIDLTCRPITFHKVDGIILDMVGWMVE